MIIEVIQILRNLRILSESDLSDFWNFEVNQI